MSLSVCHFYLENTKVDQWYIAVLVIVVNVQDNVTRSFGGYKKETSVN